MSVGTDVEWAMWVDDLQEDNARLIEAITEARKFVDLTRAHFQNEEGSEQLVSEAMACLRLVDAAIAAYEAKGDIPVVEN